MNGSLSIYALRIAYQSVEKYITDPKYIGYSSVIDKY
jgi:hypothetical protein